MTDLRTLLESLPFRLDVHKASCSDGVVFLDVAGDSYLSLYAPARCEDAAGDDDGIDRASLEMLLNDAGLLGDRKSMTGEPAPAIAPAWHPLPEPPMSRPPAAIVVAFIITFLLAGLRFRTRSLAGMLAWASKRRPRGGGVADHDLASLVGWFDRLSLWLPSRPLCLFRAHHLLHFLRRLGHDADWVFGVNLFPFHAHCWLAIGDLLVGERPDRVEEFATIYSTAGSAT